MPNPISSLDDLHAILDPSAIVTDPEAMAPHLTDWRGKHRGEAFALLRPRSVEEVSAILRWASATRTPVVPQGGNTGLSGGATPDASGDAVVLSLTRLNRIRAIDIEGDTLTAEAGCILADIQQAAAANDRLFPLSLGSEGSCQIGGVVATNAGGINVIRYGTVRDLVLGLEYVRADGAVIHGLKPLRKDNAGYALKELVIGSDGTLAVVTAATFRLFPRPRASATALCGLDSPSAALKLLSMLKQSAGERISSFELMCDGEMGLTLDLVPGTILPLEGRHAWYVFIELGDSDPNSPIGELLTETLATALEQGLLQDAAIAQSEAQARAIWHLRFAVAEANRRAGLSVSHDTSVAVADVPAFIAAIETMAAERLPNARSLRRPCRRRQHSCRPAPSQGDAGGAARGYRPCRECTGLRDHPRFRRQHHRRARHRPQPDRHADAACPAGGAGADESGQASLRPARHPQSRRGPREEVTLRAAERNTRNI